MATSGRARRSAGRFAGRARAVDAFVEKPDAARAAQYLLDGYLWNSGNFIFSARRCAPNWRRSRLT
jgi:mannose-1-phosphate guanylyltransferase